MKTSATDLSCDTGRLNTILDTILESLWLGPIDSAFSVSTAYPSHGGRAFRGHKHEKKSLRAITNFLHGQLNERMNAVLFKREEALAFNNELFTLGISTSTKSRNLGAAPPANRPREWNWDAKQDREFNFDFNALGPTLPQSQYQQPLAIWDATPEASAIKNSNESINKNVGAATPLMTMPHNLRKRNSLNILVSPAQGQFHLGKKPVEAEQQPGYLAATISSSSRLRPPRSTTPRGNIENSTNRHRYSFSPSTSINYSTRYYHANHSSKNVSSSSGHNSAGKPEISPLGLRKMKSTGILREHTSRNSMYLSPPSIPLPSLDLEFFTPGSVYSGMGYAPHGMVASSKKTAPTPWRSSTISSLYQHHGNFSRRSVQPGASDLVKNLNIITPNDYLEDVF